MTKDNEIQRVLYRLLLTRPINQALQNVRPEFFKKVHFEKKSEPSEERKVIIIPTDTLSFENNIHPDKMASEQNLHLIPCSVIKV